MRVTDEQGQLGYESSAEYLARLKKAMGWETAPESPEDKSAKRKRDIAEMQRKIAELTAEEEAHEQNKRQRTG
jgi:hypothetical protein